MAKVHLSVGKTIGLFVLMIALAAGLVLIQKNQDFREKAGSCPMSPQCPASDGILKHCLGGPPTFTSPTSTPRPGSNVKPVTYGYVYVESKCDKAGKRSTCGSQTFCCPVAGGIWTSDLSKCPLPTISGSAKPVRTISPIGTPVRDF